MLFSNYRLSKSIGSVFSSQRDVLTLNSPNVFQNHISLSVPLSFRQRDDWDVLWLPSVSTLENPAALKTPRLWRSLVTQRGSECSIAGRTSHCKTPFHQLSLWSTGGRGVDMDTASSLPSLRLKYCLFQLTSVDFDRLWTVTHKKQKKVAMEKREAVSQNWLTVCQLFLFLN